MSDITPIDGWALAAVVDIDLAYPGFAGGYLRASDERRQVIAAYLSVTQIDDDERAEAGAFLARADHRTILAKCFGQSVPGIRRALGKSGSKPHDPHYYQCLFDALTRGPTHVVTAIRQAEKLRPGKLAIIQSLSADLCDIRIIARLHGQDQAADLGKVVSLMEKHGVDRTSLVCALAKSTAPIEAVVQRWMLRLPFPTGPIPASVGYRPIRDGGELRAAALRYRNCSRRYLLDSLAGESAFAEYSHTDGRQVLIRYERRDGPWFLDGAYAVRNRAVPDDLKQAVQGLAGRYGVVERRAVRRGEDGMSALRRFGRSVFEW